jgi:hypothetical protein
MKEYIIESSIVYLDHQAVLVHINFQDLQEQSFSVCRLPAAYLGILLFFQEIIGYTNWNPIVYVFHDFHVSVSWLDQRVGFALLQLVC